ncbi:MAG: D-glycero-beta-D-manno-heptose 1-phosphate adenylyltransferase [Bacteroidales bacterium]|nr:D-glycero-beta-D-manno-heptose 1-phosphate adenylyltransferase [Bacteroidales bacterium]
MRRNTIDRIRDKILNQDQLKKILSQIRAEEQSVVFSNGCFDLVHLGHIEYLSKAADLADVFILGLNTDESVQRLKGTKRPLQDQKSRAMLMASLSFIDYVVLFNEDTPYELIQTVQPDVLVKGDDYKIEEVVGFDIVQKKGGKVITIELTKGYSTTNIVEKIKNS